MRAKKYLVLAAAVLLVGVLIGQRFVRADSKEEKAEKSKLVVLWTSGDPEVAHNVCLIYTHEAKKHNWFDEIVLIVWGPSARLLAADKELQKEVKAMIADGIDVKACSWCANKYGVADNLRELGIEVKGMGRPLTEILKGDWKVLTF